MDNNNILYSYHYRRMNEIIWHLNKLYLRKRQLISVKQNARITQNIIDFPIFRLFLFFFLYFKEKKTFFFHKTKTNKKQNKE